MSPTFLSEDTQETNTSAYSAVDLTPPTLLIVQEIDCLNTINLK